MRPTRRAIAACCLAALLSGCGGGGGSGGSSGSPAPSPAPTVSPTPTPSPSVAACSLRGRQDWARAQLDEWYLFPELLDASVNPAAHASLDSYIDALVAPARAQNQDRYFTYRTSIAEENAYYETGETAGFGLRFALDGRQLFVTEAFEGGPALATGIDRGAEIMGIGPDGANVRSVSDILAAGGGSALVDALGPDVPGVTRVLQYRDPANVERTVTVAKAVFALDPVSDRYGAKVVQRHGRRAGYINLRTFIDTAEPDLRAAFASFKAQGVTELIIDLRYNGGGLISIAELLGNLMAGGRDGQVFGYVTYRGSKAGENESFTFDEQPESIAPTKVAFLVTGDTASASEMVINGMLPYLGENMALVGANTFGKPVGQIALDRPECDDRLRAVALRIENANRQGDYYNGLARVVPVTCRTSDGRRRQLGDPDEAMMVTAFNWLEAGKGYCSPITTTTGATAARAGMIVGAPAGQQTLKPDVPRSTIERELPGAF